MTGKNKHLIKAVIELIKEPLLAFIAALLVICFIVSHTRVPTKSMMYTINPGDHLIVNHLPYYYRNPKHGEIIVFKQENDCLIKRVIAVPGDVVDIIDDKVYLNGSKLDESAYLDDNMKTYIFAGSGITFPYVVPDGYYFVMGDNRTNSTDSRFFGPISQDSIIAKAGLRISPLNKIGIVN